MNNEIVSFIEKWCESKLAALRPTFPNFNDLREHPEWASGMSNWGNCKKEISEKFGADSLNEEEEYKVHFEKYFNEVKGAIEEGIKDDPSGIDTRRVIVWFVLPSD